MLFHEVIMSEPTIAQKAPYAQELEPGTYWWCACGKSKTQPFCDGSHQGSDFQPVKFEVTEKKKYSAGKVRSHGKEKILVVRLQAQPGHAVLRRHA
jgi:CDGSH-type Zn-finger protein